MTRLRVVLRPEAQSDIERLETWLLLDGADIGTIGDYVDRLMARCRALSEAPGAGRRRDDLRPGLRTIVFERRILIAYRVGAETIEIVNIFSHGRDYEAFYLDDDEGG